VPYRDLGFLVALVGVTCLVKGRGETLSYASFGKGDFKVPVPAGNLAKDEDAKRRVALFADWLSLTREGEVAKVRALGAAAWRDDVRSKYFKYLDLESCDAHLTLCRLTQGSESQLTAVLLTGAAAMSWSERDACKPVVDALLRVTEREQTWQAKVAPLIAAVILSRGDSQTARAAGAVKGLGLLRQALPKKDDTFDATERDFQALHTVYAVRMPLRATYLAAITHLQYVLGTSEAPFNREFLQGADATCKEIISEYPGTPHAEWALGVRKKLQALREAEDDERTIEEE